MSGKPEDNLDDIYSDLSDNQETLKKKTSSTAKPPQPGVAIKMPSFLGGRAFIPPPPPPTSKPDARNIISIIPDQILQGKNHQVNPQNSNNQSQRQRKSTIYVKNIPKSYNRQQTLTTFFRTYGNIKSIKTNQQTHNAIVRFQKQQDAYRFMVKKPLILNRSYIIYDTHQDFIVNPQIVAERQKDEVVVINSSQKQIIIMKENAQSIIADKYRSLLFLSKQSNWLTEQEKNQIAREMDKCRKIKQSDSHNQQLSQMLSNFENNYDWTLTYKVITKEPIQKKKVISLYLKYGPIGSITLKLVPLGTSVEQSAEGNEDKLGIVKIKFLGVKSSWNMYFDNCESLNLEVQGNKLKTFYKSWFVKKQEQLKNKQEEQIKEDKLLGDVSILQGNDNAQQNVSAIRLENIEATQENKQKKQEILSVEIVSQQQKQQKESIANDHLIIKQRKQTKKDTQCHAKDQKAQQIIESNQKASEKNE